MVAGRSTVRGMGELAGEDARGRRCAELCRITNGQFESFPTEVFEV